MASKVGEAYVLVHTRTQPLSPAQKRALKRQAGEGARAWTSEFGKEVEANADKELAGLDKKLAQIFAKGDFDGLRKEFKDTAETAAFLRGNLERLRRQKRLNKREFDALEGSVSRWETTMEKADASMRQIAERDAFGEWLRKQEDAHRKNFTLLTRRLNQEITHHEKIDTTRRRALANSLKAWDAEFKGLERSVLDTDKMLRQAYEMNSRHDERTARLQEQANERMRRTLAQAYRMNEQFDERNEARQARANEQQRRMLATAYRMHDQFVDREEESLARRMGIHRRHLSDLDAAYRRNLGQIYEIFDRNEGGANRFTRGLNRMNRQVSRMPDIVGVIFGRGSRNNLLNFLGNVMRNLSMIPATLVSAFTGIVDKVSSTVEAFTMLSRSMGPMRAAFVLARVAVVGVVALIGTLAIALVSAAFAVPALAAAISMLAGVFTAWAGVLVTAVLGALVPLVPLLAIVGGGFVALAVAMGRYWSRMQEIKEDGGRLTREMRLLDEAVDRMSTSMDRFTNRVAPEAARSFAIIGNAVAGFLDAIGPGVARGLERFNDSINSPATRRFAQMWAERMPRIFESFTAGLGQMTSGLIAFFVPILPYVQRLADGFDNMMSRFSEWAGSARGQNTIAEWMERAWRAADSLWSILGNVWGILSSLFNVGTDAAGQGFLSNLERITAEFDKWLKTDEGRASLTEWFEDAAEFASKLWEILGDIGTAFQSLDTQQARDDLNSFLGLIERIVELSDGVAKFFETLRKGFGSWWGENETTKAGVREMFDVDGDTWSEIASNMWEGLTSAISSGVSSWWGENETTKSWARKVFKVDGATWSEIASQVWSGLTDAVGSAVSSWWGENDTTKAWARKAFDVDGGTWSEIASNIWSGFSSAISGAVGSWLGENETTKSMVRDLFKVEGTGWSDIISNLWSGFSKAFFGWNPSRGKENEKTKQIVRDIFKVDGGTWNEIATTIMNDLVTAIDEAGASARGRNPKTMQFFRDLFNVDGATYSEIAQNVWDNLLTAIGETAVFAYRENPHTKQFVKDLFKVEGGTWVEIISSMWTGFWSAFNSAGDTARTEGNPKTQAVFRKVFNVEGETWGEITSNMWTGFTTALGDLAAYAWAGNPKTQGIFRQVFNVEGETWGQILTNMWTGFTGALGRLAAYAWAGNPETQAIFRQVFQVEGETWGQIFTNIWNGFTDGLGRLVAYAWAPNPKTQEIIRGIFQVEGETWTEIGSNIWNGFTTGLGNFAEHSALAETVKTVIKDIFNVDGATWSEIGTNIWQGLHDGINSAFSAAGDWIAGVIDTYIVQPVMRALGMASPSMVFFNIGVNIVQGLINGFVFMWESFWTIVSTSFTTFVTSVGTWLSALPGIASTWLSQMWAQVSTWFSQMWSTASTWTTQLVTDVSTWISQLPGRISAWLSQAWAQVSTWFSQMWSTATTYALSLVTDVSTWISGLPGKIGTWLSQAWASVSRWFASMYSTAVEKAQSLVNDAVSAISALPGRIGTALSGLAEAIAAPFRSAYNTAKGWWDSIASLGRSTPSVTAPSLQGGSSSRFASGGIVTRTTRALVGEAGPEAVVPLNRPLSLVDPSVRALSALLQGKGSAMVTSSPGPSRPNVVFAEGSIVVQTLATDVVGIAESVVDRIAVRAGI